MLSDEEDDTELPWDRRVGAFAGRHGELDDAAAALLTQVLEVQCATVLRERALPLWSGERSPHELEAVSFRKVCFQMLIGLNLGLEEGFTHSVNGLPSRSSL
ncbi:hypothetical protein NKH16_24315 [Mesorhizobium sp. M1307]|uniref:hypothetical protein n=1 Tax=Mesorhizobium sp. M1307 TaxID=2957079 RepID=UPI0033398EF8